MTAASSETFLNELLWMAGGQNVIGRTLSRYPRVSKEGIVDLDPEVIFDLTFTTEGEDILAVWSALPTLSAVRTGKDRRPCPIRRSPFRVPAWYERWSVSWKSFIRKWRCHRAFQRKKNVETPAFETMIRASDLSFAYRGGDDGCLSVPYRAR